MGEETVTIDKNLEFDFYDLMLDVNFDHEFTLKDVFTAVENSQIPLLLLSQILHCPHLDKFIEEMDKDAPVDEDNSIEFLELYWWGSEDTYEGKHQSSNSWCFHGVGKTGVVGDDVRRMYEHQGEEVPEDYTERYAIELTPVYELADLPIKICPRMHYTDYDADVKSDLFDTEKEFTCSITLIDLLYGIFWELSFCGSPEKRDEKVGELNETIEEFEKAKREGREFGVEVDFDALRKMDEEDNLPDEE